MCLWWKANGVNPFYPTQKKVRGSASESSITCHRQIGSCNSLFLLLFLQTYNSTQFRTRIDGRGSMGYMSQKRRGKKKEKVFVCANGSCQPRTRGSESRKAKEQLKQPCVTWPKVHLYILHCLLHFLTDHQWSSGGGVDVERQRHCVKVIPAPLPAGH